MINFSQSRRQPGQVECHPADYGRAIRFRSWGEAFAFQSAKDKEVDLVLCPCHFFHLWQWWSDRLRVGPVTGIDCALFDPVLQKRDFGLGKLLAGLWRWHLVVGIVGRNASDQFALLRVTRQDGLMTAQTSLGPFGCIQAQSILSTFALLGVRAVTLETVVGKNAADVAIKVNRLRSLGGTGDRSG